MSVKLTVVFRRESSANSHTHVVERAEVVGQSVVVLLVESCHSPERVPLKLGRFPVPLDTERRHDSIEIRLLTARPTTTLNKQEFSICSTHTDAI